MNTQQAKEYFLNMGDRRKPGGAPKAFETFKEILSIVKGGVVLDAGAGELRFKPFFEDSIYISQEHTAGIRLKGMEAAEYDFVSPLDEKVPLKDDCVDGIISNSVLEHIRYPEKFIAEAFRVLKPGGKIFISVPFVILEHEAPFDFQRPTRYGLKRWLEDVGFTKIKIKPSSTCTYGTIACLGQALVYDILQTNKNPRNMFWGLLRSKNGYLKVIRKFHKFVFAGIAWYSVILFNRLLNFLINIDPYEEANIPAGWISVAAKPGPNIKRRYKNKKEFLNKNSLILS